MENRGSPEGLTPGDEGNSLAGKELTQAVQVALNIRPLIALERAQGCKDCISVVPGEPQVIFFLRYKSLAPLLVSIFDDFCLLHQLLHLNFVAHYLVHDQV